MYMKYKFYINVLKKLTPINKEYSFVIDQFHLYDSLSTIWAIDTCAPRLRNKWSKECPTVGECSITSFLVQDIFGGEVFAVKLDNGDTHCYNKVGDVIFDLTSEQFGEQKLVYNLENPQSRETHFLDKEKENRYLLLKKRLLQKNIKN